MYETRATAASPGRRFGGSGSAVALVEPNVDLVLEVIDDAWAAAMIGRPIAFHAPFGKGRTTEAEVARNNYGPESLMVIWGHRRFILAGVIPQLPSLVTETPLGRQVIKGQHFRTPLSV